MFSKLLIWAPRKNVEMEESYKEDDDDEADVSDD